MFAHRTGDVDLLKYLLEKGANLNVEDHHGYSPLMWAVHDSLFEVSGSAPIMIDYGANLNVQIYDPGTKEDGMTPLMLAIHHRYFTLVDMLINKGADITIKDAKGRVAQDILRESLAFEHKLIEKLSVTK